MTLTMFGRKLVESGLTKKKQKTGWMYLDIKLKSHEQTLQFSKAL